jgi:hypothetical protein
MYLYDILIFDAYYNSLSTHINCDNTITTPLRQNKKKTLPRRESLIIIYIGIYYPRNANKIPAATAEPITPDTLGPIACIKRKFAGFSS